MKPIRDWLPELLLPPLIAILFLTRLPVHWLCHRLCHRLLSKAPAKTVWSERHQGLSTLWYPPVGLLLALLIFLIAGLLPASAPPLLQALVMVVLWVLLTGALHLDGLADSVDAASAAHRLSAIKEQPQPILAVFKDPAAGPMAVAALVLVILSKVILLASLQGPVLPALIAALVLSRVLALVLMVSTPYVRSAGSGSALMAGLPKSGIWLLVLSCSLLTVFFLPLVPALALLILLILLMYWWRQLWLRTIGGYVGDCVGALIELAEVLILLVWCCWSYV